MRANEFLTGNDPTWKHDPASKSYVVYDADGVEVARFTYKDQFNRSKEYDSAVKKVKELKLAAYELAQQKKNQEQENAPLTKFEIEYIQKHKSWKDLYAKLAKADPASQKEYSNAMHSLMARMMFLQNSRLIREKIILNTDKFYNLVP